MRAWIPRRKAATALLAGLGVLAAFHLIVMLGVLPGTMVWGGRAGGPDGNVVVMELVGLVLTLIFMLVTAVRSERLRAPGLAGAAAVGAWVVFGFFLLSFVGNLASTSALERAIFIPFSALLALLALRVALRKREGDE